MKELDLGPTGLQVAGRVTALRDARRLTYKALAAKLDEVGWPIAEMGLRRIEAKARRVTADEVVALAVALSVSPLELLLPSSSAPASPPTGVPEDVTNAEAWAWAKEETSLGAKQRLAYWTRVRDQAESELARTEAAAASSQIDSMRDVFAHNVKLLRERVSESSTRIDELSASLGVAVSVTGAAQPPFDPSERI